MESTVSTSDQQSRRVDVRQKWSHEAHDFTPWLADNLNLLGAELGLSLELVAREKPVGPYYLDILAKTGTEELVAIENQLEWTDFGHLAQLLVYSAGCGARAAIWVATEFLYELAEVLHRLNKWTVDGISFYGVKIEAVQTAEGSEPEPRFRKVVYPGGWDKNETQPPGRIESEDARKHRKFFEPLIADVARAGHLPQQPIQMHGPSGRHFPSPGVQGIWYAASLEGMNDAWVTLYIRTTDTDLTKYMFDTLHTDREQIESHLTVDPAPEWHWRRHDKWAFSTINIRRDGSIDDPPEKRHVIRTWMLEFLPKLKDVFEPRIAEILDTRARQDQELESSPVDGDGVTA